MQDSRTRIPSSCAVWTASTAFPLSSGTAVPVRIDNCIGHAHRHPRRRPGRALSRLSDQAPRPRRRRSPSFEQNPPDATFGFGVVFSDRALEFLRADDEETYAAITPQMETWNDMTLSPSRRARRDRRHRLCRHRAAEAAATVAGARRARSASTPHYGRAVKSARRIGDADLVVGADGVNSLVRAACASELGASVRLSHQSLRLVRHQQGASRR